MSKNTLRTNETDALILQIKEIVDRAKKKIATTLNQELLLTYWQIGKIITQHNSPDEKSDRAFILEISKILTTELGKGYSRSTCSI